MSRVRRAVPRPRRGFDRVAGTARIGNHDPVIGVVLSAVVLLPLSVTGTATALPAIAGDFGTGQRGVGWAINGFNIAFAFSVILAGACADRFGLRRVFAIGIALFAAASSGCGFAPTYA